AVTLPKYCRCLAGLSAHRHKPRPPLPGNCLQHLGLGVVVGRPDVLDIPRPRREECTRPARSSPCARTGKPAGTSNTSAAAAAGRRPCRTPPRPKSPMELPDSCRGHSWTLKPVGKEYVFSLRVRRASTVQA